MHFAVGMGCAGLAGLAACSILGRGWRWLPAAMTVGGFWALVPDFPRIWREDFPHTAVSSFLGSKQLETWLHSRGDLFFFHNKLDIQPNEYALHGLMLIILLYNAAMLLLMWLPRKERAAFRQIRADAVPKHRAASHAQNQSVSTRDHPLPQRIVRSSHLARSA